MRWRAAIGLAGIAVAGCGEVADDERNEAAAAPQNQAAGAPDEPVEPAEQAEPRAGQATSRAGTSLPPAGAELRYVGLWASSAANCEDSAWQFTASSLETPAGSVCDFRSVSEVPGGYDIRATCTAEGPPTEDRITLRFAESAKAMLFESDAIADAGLIYCGRGA